MRKLRATIALSFVTALALCGCSGRMPAQVSGAVTLDGKPLSKGTVAFHPRAEGTTAVSVIDTAGHYTVRTGTAAGLAPGEYRVTVTVVSAPPAPGASPEEIAALFLIPRRYTDPETSGITCEVERGSSTFDIELTSP